jgi:Uma2 family endonuclease
MTSPALVSVTPLSVAPRTVPKSPPRYVRPPRPIHFPAEEEAPETNRHLELRTALYLILKRAFSAHATAGSDQFVYYDPTSAKKRLAPDAFLKLGVPHAPFRVWKTWLRGAPDLAVEVVSDSDEGEEAWDQKLERYRACGIGEVVRFDADDEARPIRVWDHVDGDLVERVAPEDGLFECVCLGLWWTAQPHPTLDRMLRLARDREGRVLLPTPEDAEAHGRAEEAHGRAEAERARDQLAAEVTELRWMLAQRTKRAPRKPTKGKAPSSRVAPSRPRRG